MNISDLSPYAVAAKVVAVAVAAAALVMLVMSWSARGQTINHLTEWQSSIVQVTTDATVLPDAKGKRALLKPETVAAAIAGLKRSSDSCHEAAAEVTARSEEQKKRADAADLALANVQTILKGEYSSAQARINALEHAKTGATPDLKCQAIGVDSKAAWEAWK